MRAILLALMICAAGGCTDSNYASDGGGTVDESYAVTGYRFGGIGVGTVWVFARYEERDGRVRVCGAWAEDALGVVEARENWHTLGMAVLYHNDDRMIQGIAFMKQFKDHRTALGQPANCVLTQIPWHPRYAAEGLELRI